MSQPSTRHWRSVSPTSLSISKRLQRFWRKRTRVRRSSPRHSLSKLWLARTSSRWSSPTMKRPLLAHFVRGWLMLSTAFWSQRGRRHFPRHWRVAFPSRLVGLTCQSTEGQVWRYGIFTYIYQSHGSYGNVVDSLWIPLKKQGEKISDFHPAGRPDDLNRSLYGEYPLIN